MTTTHRSLPPSLVLVAALGGLAAGCGASGATPTASDTLSSAAPATASVSVPATDCGDDLEAAVQERSPGYGAVAVDRCEDGWAYVGAEQGMGDTEQVWRVEDDAWVFVTAQPSELCPVDLAKRGAPQWVVDLFAYREYAC